MEPAHIPPAVDPAKAPRAHHRDLKVPVLPNPIRAAPAPKSVPTHAGVKAPKTKPTYGMTRPIYTAPSHVRRDHMG